MKRFFPRKIFIEKAAVGAPLTQRVLESCPGVSREIVRDRRDVLQVLQTAADPIAAGKSVLFLSRQKGAWVKPCPCAPRYLGCNYWIINSVLNCPLDCAYCILQLYLANPLLTVFVNLDAAWKELDSFLATKAGRFCRIGTGELSDSLALDHLTGMSEDFISYFRSRPAALFELKTKTINIEGLQRCRPAENVVVSWSLNASRVGRTEEKGAASVTARLAAAAEVARQGFTVGFHLDPLILFPGWEEEYGQVIEKMFAAVPVQRVRWISLGSLRFPVPLKRIIQRRFPGSPLACGELVPGRDGKLRYFKPLRHELYKTVVGLIRKRGGEKVPVYLCMEDAETWEKTLEWRPRRKAEVELSLSPRVDGFKSNVQFA